jgi:myo-inositol-1(or 4)-monophosphatase
MMLPDIDTLRDLVTRTAQQEILPRFNSATREIKHDGSIVTEIDRRVQARLQEALHDRWPEYRFLGEEMSERQQQLALDESRDGLWCLDPLDGTSNFASGLPFFSVSLALIRERRPVLGLVYDPVREECFTAIEGQGADLNGQRIEHPTEVELRRCIACVDFKRLPGYLAGQLAQAFPYMSQRNIGSCALDWCWLATGRFQVYIHGGMKLWDYAAGELILKETGGCALTLDAEPIFSDTLQPRSVVAATNPELFDSWKLWIDSHRA